jgi:hypothetical protein
MEACMNQPEPAPSARRIVRKIVITYTLEGDDSKTEHTLGLAHTGGGEVVDGVVWSHKLMNRLRYEDPQRPGQAVPVTRRPGDRQQWRRVQDDGTASASTASTTENGNGDTDLEDCIWYHEDSCYWRSFCDPW